MVDLTMFQHNRRIRNILSKELVCVGNPFPRQPFANDVTRAVLRVPPNSASGWSKYNLMDALIAGALAVSSASIGFDISDVQPWRFLQRGK
jgi:hypothetical protein